MIEVWLLEVKDIDCLDGSLVEYEEIVINMAGFDLWLTIDDTGQLERIYIENLSEFELLTKIGTL